MTFVSLGLEDFAGPYAVYVADDRVYFEHNERGEGDSIRVFVMQGNICYDYDMAYGMIPEAREWLDANGYDTNELLG
jgi:hypothetical protein